MTLSALQCLVRSAAALAGDRHFLVLGSASLLASFPDPGNEGSTLSATYDADLYPELFDELTGTMLDEQHDRPPHRLHLSGARTEAKQVLAELGLGVPGLSLETGLAKRQYPLMFRRPTV